MAQGIPCSCEVKDKSNWRIAQYKGNHSYFGNRAGKFQPSAYSKITCLKCGSFWRTKAEYVEELEFLVIKDGKFY